MINIQSPELKTKAFEKTVTNFPRSRELLLLAIAAPHYNLNTGHIIPYIKKISKDDYELQYLINLNPEEIKTIQNGENEAVNKLGITLHKEDKLVRPDLRPHFVKFKLSIRSIGGWDIRYFSLDL